MSQEPTIRTVTAEGIHVRAGSVERVAPLPDPLPVGAEATEWDADTRTLTYTTPPAEEGGEPAEHTVVLTEEELAAAIDYRGPEPAPQRVSKAQLKLALLAQGIDLTALIDQLPADQRPAARILVEDASHFERGASMVAAFASAAGLNDAQVNDLFRAAAAIDPAKL